MEQKGENLGGAEKDQREDRMCVRERDTQGRVGVKGRETQIESMAMCKGAEKTQESSEVENRVIQRGKEKEKGGKH